MKIVAHRGARSRAPENTLSAFRTALTLPVDFIEGDITLTKDGVPVLIHQETLEPSSGALRLAARDEGRAWALEMPWSELSALDAGTWFGNQFRNEKIPSLDDVLALEWKEKMPLFDLIDPYYWIDEADPRMVEAFKRSVIPPLRVALTRGIRFSVLAFNPKMLELFAKELPRVDRTLAVWTNQRGKVSDVGTMARDLGVSTLTIPDFFLRDEPEWEAEARRLHLKLGVFELTPDSVKGFSNWTPRDRQPLWDLVISRNVDVFTSDFPAEFRAYRDRVKCT